MGRCKLPIIPDPNSEALQTTYKYRYVDIVKIGIKRGQIVLMNSKEIST